MTNLFPMRTRARTRLFRVAALALLIAVALAGRRLAAAPTELFFSEYIEGTSNNKALEIYNGTGSAINLATAGYTVEMYFNGATTPVTTVNLTGTVPAGDVYVLAQSAANATILAQADQTSSASWYNGDDAVVLKKGTTVIDVIGQIGFDPGTEWGTGLTSTADNTLRRNAAISTGDASGGDVFNPAAEWTGFATDTFDGLGCYTGSCSDTAPALTSVLPGSGASEVALGTNVTLTFNEPVNVTGSWFTLSCSASGSHTAVVSGGPTTFTLNPDSDFVYGDVCTVTVLAAGVADQDATDPPDHMAADFTSSFNAVATDPCTLSYTPIYQIQGSGPIAAINGAVTTAGVVVGDFEVPSGTLPPGQVRGFYIQEPSGDGDTRTSDGIFVFNPGNNSVKPGDFVRVSGSAGEFQGQTQIGSVSAIHACGTGTITPTEVSLPFSADNDPEWFEGMLVKLPQTLIVTEHFQLGRFGQVLVSSGGRLDQPTDVATPGAAAQAQQVANDLNQVLIDDGSNIEDPDPIVFGRNGNPLSASNTLRGGDTVTGTVGVMTYTWAGNAASGNAFRVRPINALDGFVKFVAANPRPAAAPAVPAGALRVASMNLLNFFNTFSGCTNGAGGAATDCRGANSAAEFARQWPKTVAAVVGTKADVIGILEIENDGYGTGSAISFLVDKLNAATAPGTYAFIDADARVGQDNTLGTDAIKVGLLYKPARVIPIGQTAALNTDSFVTGGDSGPRNRPSLAQAFEEFATGARFIVDVNHLKSKGSVCDAADAGDGQGNCNAVRVNAANELVAWLAGGPTGVQDSDVVILGDLNSYSKEDPITALVAAGFTNLVPAWGGGHSYAFDGQWGSLDHALASPSLAPQVVGAVDWYINADEPSILDYNTDFKSPGQIDSLYAPDWFRISDHNPLLLDLMLTVPFDTSAKVTGGGEIVLVNSGGLNAGDAGSTLNFAVNAKFTKNAVQPQGVTTIVLRRTVGDEERVYQVRTMSLTSLLRDPSTGRGTVTGTATITDITDPSAPVVIDSNATLRTTVDDNGEPGVFSDTVGFTVVDGAGSLWFSSNLSGSQTSEQAIVGGNVQVR